MYIVCRVQLVSNCIVFEVHESVFTYLNTSTALLIENVAGRACIGVVKLTLASARSFVPVMYWRLIIYERLIDISFNTQIHSEWGTYYNAFIVFIGVPANTSAFSFVVYLKTVAVLGPQFTLTIAFSVLLNDERYPSGLVDLLLAIVVQCKVEHSHLKRLHDIENNNLQFIFKQWPQN